MKTSLVLQRKTKLENKSVKFVSFNQINKLINIPSTTTYGKIKLLKTN